MQYAKRFPTLFLSTLSLRRATFSAGTKYDTAKNFYPRSPCGERLGCWMALNRLLRFLSTLSLRRATEVEKLVPLPSLISIHALLAESDRFQSFCQSGKHYFYPRSPCGERLLIILCPILAPCISIHALLAESDSKNPMICIDKIPFLSTLSLRRATPTTSRNNKNNVFLSTLSLRRATQ